MSAKQNVQGARTGKSILLFSDGTGNSSGALYKTNVWRTYEAVDLGPAAPGQPLQIACYDNGVGTSAFRPFAMLAGIFGFGLKRNILELYRFACRNYRPGDAIYAFGFSRGAFTVRVLIALIASQGLAPAKTEAELRLASIDAYRRYRAKYLPRYLPWPTQWLRRLRDAVVRVKRQWCGQRVYERTGNRTALIRFIGVWDTVAAYGGPIVEIVRGIDNWIYGLSMPDYALHPEVKAARHALALDDAREAFHPLVWDEVDEQRLRVENPSILPGRLQQLWFTGMHADVGGGYPDESLSYVSLLWMLEEARKAGLRTLDAITDRYLALANSTGPIHDSRSGPGVYYRYRPRRLAALLHKPHEDTRAEWLPERTRSNGGKGALTAIRIHESVAARITRGTDGYAPIVLPGTFEIHPPQQDGQNAVQATQGAGHPAARTGPVAMVRGVATWLTRAWTAAGQPIPILSRRHARRLLNERRGAVREAAMERVWDLVWWRRWVYALSLAATLLLLTMPWWPLLPWTAPVDAWCDDSRCVLPGIFSPIKAFVPSFVGRWLDSFAARPVPATLLFVALFVLWKYGTALETRIAARARAAWLAVLSRGPCPPPKAETGGIARWLRRNRPGIAVVRGLRWHVLPLICAALLIATGATLVTAGATQIWLAYAEWNGTFCRADEPLKARPVSIFFKTTYTCADTGIQQVRGRRYLVVMQAGSTPPKDGRSEIDWKDKGLAANPAAGVTDNAWKIWLFGLHRRVTGARWMKPLAIVRKNGAARGATAIEVLDLYPIKGRCYLGTFTSPRDGRLYLSVNDMALPLDDRYFYKNNEGTANIRVVRAPKPMQVGPMPTPPDLLLLEKECNKVPIPPDRDAPPVATQPAGGRTVAAR